MSNHSDTLSWFRESTSLCSFSLMMLSGEATHTTYRVFGLTRSEIDPTIYRTRGEHANHYWTLWQSVKNIQIIYGIILEWSFTFNVKQFRTSIHFQQNLKFDDLILRKLGRDSPPTTTTPFSSPNSTTVYKRTRQKMFGLVHI